jgi:lipoprotein-anchoring transpeptidase ErfK/SrfK
MHSCHNSSSIFFNHFDRQQINVVEDLCNRINLQMTEWLILVNVTTQKMHLLQSKTIKYSYPISTGKNGVGQTLNSGKTPLGLHCIASKIGTNEHPLAIFKNQRLTGDIATIQEGGEDIVGRILQLIGLQPGFNQGINDEGTCVDTLERKIYIHGTNDPFNIGKPVSHGCVRMLCDDVVDLFHKAPAGTLVFIYT